MPLFLVFLPLLLIGERATGSLTSNYLHSNYIDIVKTCIRDTLSEYYSGGNIDDCLHVEL
jgi:hypothetical protein